LQKDKFAGSLRILLIDKNKSLAFPKHLESCVRDKS
jgi:hypothetical protein